MKYLSLSVCLVFLCAGFASGFPAEGRFVEVVKNNTADTRLHIGEIEVFDFVVTPDGADADGTSSNDLVQAGSPSTETPPTTTSLEHGLATSVFDGDLEGGAQVWSTSNGLGVEPRYMLDLGATEDVGIVRVWGRADTCCTNRLQDFTVNVYEDDGTGQPGTLVSSVMYPGTAPNASTGHAELDLSIADPGVVSFVVDRPLAPSGDAVTFSWEVSLAATSVTIDNGVGDVTALTDAAGIGTFTLNPGPSVDTTYLLTVNRPQGPTTATVMVDVTNLPVIYSYTVDDGLVGPGDPVTLTWDVANATALTLNGTNVTGTTSLVVNPTVTTTYLLAAANANGLTTESILVHVVIPGEPLISEFLAVNSTGLLDEDGEATDWIEIHNPGPSPISLAGYYLTDEAVNLSKWAFPNVSVAGNGYLVVFASGLDRAVAGSELHTNFSLASGGEYLALVKPDGVTILSTFGTMYGQQRGDVSFGIDPSGGSDGYFVVPTPGAVNGESTTGFVADTSFSLDRGFYTGPILVGVTSATPGAQIRYTLDGVKPTATSGMIYTGPIPITQTTVLRAAAFKAGMVGTNVDTHTYLYTADIVNQTGMDTGITQDATYGPQMEASLRSLPTLSITVQSTVVNTEQEISIEMIDFPDGDNQVDAGVRRFGGEFTNFAKVSMRVEFRKQYGPGKLDFPVFAGQDYSLIDPADLVDGLDLRAGNHDMVSRGAYMSNRFADDSMLDMGHVNPHGRFVHVYLNGDYWGQYHMRERWNGEMLQQYFGGPEEEYEAINAKNAGSNFLTGVVYDGSGVEWAETQSLLAGANPYSSVKDHLDLPNMIDFMMLWVSGNAESEFKAAGAPNLGVGFGFNMKDADGFLRSSGRDLTHNGPLNSLVTLRNESDPEFNVLLADRIHKHFFNGGAMTGPALVDRLQKRVDETELSFISEAARWGYRSPSSWESYQNNLLNNYLPGLGTTMLGRFQSGGMYPSLEAPVYGLHGGAVLPGFQLGMTAPAGTIYYTTDGSDPREPGDPVVVNPPVNLVAGTAAKTVYVPTTSTDGFVDGGGLDWNEVGYADGGWTSGSGGVGYEDGSGYDPYFSIDTLAEMNDTRTSCLIRIPFTPSAADLAGKMGMSLGVQYDDGYVAYLNGVEIARKNFVGTPDGDSNANANHDDGAAIVYEPVNVTADLGLLQAGQVNVLAIHGMNRNTGSSDFLINAELEVSESATGGGSGGAVGATATAYTGTVPVGSTMTVKSRTLAADGTWSALTEADFFQDPSVVVISEIMYNPGAATPAEVAAGFGNSEDFEFVELYNTGTVGIDLAGLIFDDGVSFDLSLAGGTILGAGQRAVLVKNQAAFEFRYGTGHVVLGEYGGKLKDEGERLALVDGTGAVVHEVTYNQLSPWPTEAAGLGYSLVLVNPTSLPDHTLVGSWVASDILGGSPGGVSVPATAYATWAAGFGVGAEGDDPDGDGLMNYLEWLLLSSPIDATSRGDLTYQIESGSLVMTATYNLAASGATAAAEVSTNLIGWSPAVLDRTVYHGDGTATGYWRPAVGVSGAMQQFLRMRFD